MDSVAGAQQPQQPAAGARLNLGCGEDYRTGQAWHNVDIRSAVGPDQVVDLRERPWPWPDDHFSGAVADNVIEHLPVYESLAELARVLEPGSVAEIAGPHWHSTGAWNDPTHTRPLMPESLTYYELGDAWELRSVEWECVRWGRVLPDSLAVWLADMVGQGVTGWRANARVTVSGDPLAQGAD